MGEKTLLDDISLDNLTWSNEEFILSDFLDKFPLPQIVKVQEGYYGPDEDSCLGADQILFLHAVKNTEKVQARDVKRRELHIPLNCSQKLEIRPSNLKEAFESVAELAEVFTIKKIPKFVRVTQGYNSIEGDNLCLNPGDKLKLLEVVCEGKQKYLKVESQDGSGFPLCIPLTACARCQPLQDGREYYIKEAVDSTKMPFFFQFIKPLVMTDTGEASVFNSTLGVLRAEKRYHDSSVLCTTQEGETRTVVTCPKSLQITVTAASGALVGDQEYMRICRFFHDGVSLKRIENMECFNVFASRDTIREYHYDVPKTPSSPSENELGSGDDDVTGDPDYENVPNAQNNSLTSNKFDYEKFKSSFDGEALLNNDDSEGDNYEDAYVQPVIPSTSTAPVLYLKKRTPPPVKPKPVSKTKGRHTPDTMLTTTANGQNELSEGKKTDTITASKEPDMIPKEQSEHQTPGTMLTATTNGQKESSEGKKTDTSTAFNKLTDTNSNEIQDMTVQEVADFLKKHRLSDFVEIFEHNQIDGDMLMCIDVEMMEAFGMNKFQQKKLSRLIQGWRPKC